MPREKAEIVRQPIALRASSHRRILERLMLRVPRISAFVTRVVLSLPPASKFRQAMVRNFARLVFEAANRGDYEAAFALLPEDYETVTPPDLVGLGFDPAYRGRDGRLRFQQQWLSELEEFHNEPEEVVDVGDRLLLLGRMKGIGAGSGAAFDSEVAYVLTLSGGRIIREESFRSHAEAFEVAGLQKGA
jgi:ketosteroid isomerase-like protein